MKKQADVGGRLAIIEVTLHGVQDHVAKFVPGIALSGDALANSYRNVTSV